MTSALTVIAALASIQVLLVVKLADVITDGTDARGTRAVRTNAGIA